MELTHQRILIFAACGAISSEVARQAASAGATVLLSVRDSEKLVILREEIAASGGRVETAVVDAKQRGEIEAYLQKIENNGGFDAVFNGIGPLAPFRKPMLVSTQP